MEKHLRLKENSPEGGTYIVARSVSKGQKKWAFIDLEYLEMIAPGNKGFFAEMMKIFRTESVLSVNKMKEQIMNDDYNALAKTAHAMKPTGTYIGVNSMTTLVSNLERVAPAGNAGEIERIMQELQRMVTNVNLEIDEYLGGAA